MTCGEDPEKKQLDDSTYGSKVHDSCNAAGCAATSASYVLSTAARELSRDQAMIKSHDY